MKTGITSLISPSPTPIKAGLSGAAVSKSRARLRSRWYSARVFGSKAKASTVGTARNPALSYNAALAVSRRLSVSFFALESFFRAVANAASASAKIFE